MGTKSMLLRLASAAALTAVAACGAGGTDAGNGGEDPSEPGTGADVDRVYEGLVTVIETPTTVPSWPERSRSPTRRRAGAWTSPVGTGRRSSTSRRMEPVGATTS
ncbi:hypothetical protein GCM10029992_52810 [Glycomyces albus]